MEARKGENPLSGIGSVLESERTPMPDAADELALREPLLSSEGVQKWLVGRVAATDLARLPPERLVAIAAETDTLVAGTF